jgi:DNA repair ATPase RecN
MTEEIKDVNAAIDDLAAAKKKYASADTVISIGGYEFTPAKLMIAFTLVSSILGGLYGCFEVYKDYMGMKDKIAKYVSPDLSELYKKLEVLEANTNKTVEYSQDIKNDLKGDIRRLEGVVENVERDSKTAQRDTDKSVQDARKDVRETKQEVDKITRQLEKDTTAQNKELQRQVDQAVKQLQKENEQEIKQLRRELDDKIKKALDNPLANR